jgi:hypothetical protein
VLFGFFLLPIVTILSTSTKWSEISSIQFRLRFHFGTLKQTILHYLTERRVYVNYVIGKPSVLFLPIAIGIHNSYFVIKIVEDPCCLQPSSEGPSRSISPSQRPLPSRSISPSQRPLPSRSISPSPSGYLSICFNNTLYTASFSRSSSVRNSFLSW